jgi:hypothetical protein
VPKNSRFVYTDPDGREIDVHVMRFDEHGVVAQWTCPYKFTLAGLQGQGTVAGHSVRCLTREMQLAAHTGYELPPHHVADLRLLGA